MRKFNVILLAACLAVLSSCSGDDTVARSTVTVDISGLERLENGAQYQAWISDGVDLTSLGRFTDVEFPKTFEALTGEVENATQFLFDYFIVYYVSVLKKICRVLGHCQLYFLKL